LKNIFTSEADIIPNYKNNTLTVIIHSLATPRDNEAVKNICTILNDTETIYPNTNLKLIYKTLAN